jgi:hypothetical protein
VAATLTEPDVEALGVRDSVGVTLAVTSETATLGASPAVACACVQAPPLLQLKAVIAVLMLVAPVAYTEDESTPEIFWPQAPPAVSVHVATKVMTVLPPQSTLAPTLPGCSMRRAEHVTALLTMLASTQEMLEVAGCGHEVPSGCARWRLGGEAGRRGEVADCGEAQRAKGERGERKWLARRPLSPR